MSRPEDVQFFRIQGAAKAAGLVIDGVTFDFIPDGVCSGEVLVRGGTTVRFRWVEPEYWEFTIQGKPQLIREVVSEQTAAQLRVLPAGTKRFKRKRDMQRQRLYQAEGALHKAHKPFDNFDDVLILVRRLTNDPWLRKHYPRAIYTTVHKKHHGNAHAIYARWEIRLPRWAWKMPCILHELAHICVSKPGAVQGHGREFARCYLQLVRHYMGKEAYAQLKAGYAEQRIKHRLVPTTGKRTVGNPAALARWREAQKAALTPPPKAQ